MPKKKNNKSNFKLYKLKKNIYLIAIIDVITKISKLRQFIHESNYHSSLHTNFYFIASIVFSGKTVVDI